jgi:hypothetical protein
MIEMIVAGLGVLTGLGAFVGLAVDREARRRAWDRVARARHVGMRRLRDVEQRELRAAVLENDLDTRERRLDLREHWLLQRELALEGLERSVRSELAPGA